jgi:hypothetical protein
MTTRYREDIDGLRALAVLSVIGFHFEAPRVFGDFVGVDIFFVISAVLSQRAALLRPDLLFALSLALAALHVRPVLEQRPHARPPRQDCCSRSRL